MKVLFMANIPSPYRVDFFNKLGELCDLTVSFEGATGLNRDGKWKGKAPISFTPVYMNGFRYNEEQFVCLDVLKLVREKWDVIIVGVYSSITSMIAIEYMKLHKIPFVISADGGFVAEENSFKASIKKYFMSSASYWLSTGRATTEYLAHYGADNERCFVFPFTSMSKADLNYASMVSQQDKGKIREKLGIHQHKVIISVGQFIHRKGFDLLIKSAKVLPVDVGIYIIGGEPTSEYLQMREEMDVKNVHFIGFKKKEELADYYAAADLFVFPTREDIWGLVVNEALAFGVPVITTDRCVAGLELIRNGENGYIIPANDQSALNNAIQKVLSREIELSMRQYCVSSVANYSIETMAEIHYEIFSRIVTGLS